MHSTANLDPKDDIITSFEGTKYSIQLLTVFSGPDFPTYKYDLHIF